MPTDPPSLLSQLRWTDLVAVIGALAWLPHVIRLVRRPRVGAIVGSQVEIGFTGLGPIFNPSIAYRSRNREALLTNFVSDLVHQTQQRTQFRATQMTEVGPYSQSSGGEQVFFHLRTQAAVALVVAPGQITERKVQSIEVSSKALSDPLVVAYERAIRRLQVENENDWWAAVRGSAEYHALRDLWRKAFIWQAGEYLATVTCKIDDSSRTAVIQFRFSLTEQHINLLQDNMNGLDWELARIWGQYAVKETTPYKWQWAYPDVRAP